MHRNGPGYFWLLCRIITPDHAIQFRNCIFLSLLLLQKNTNTGEFSGQKSGKHSPSTPTVVEVQALFM